LEPETGPVVGIPSFSPILWLKLPFSLVQTSSRLTLRLYAKRSAHPDILLGTHEMPIPLASQSSSFIENPLSFNKLNISRADISCVLENGVAVAAQSTQPITIYIVVNSTSSTLDNSPPSIPTADNGSPAEEVPIPARGHTQSPSPEQPSPPSHHQHGEVGNNEPRSREEVPHASTEDLCVALSQADQAMKRVDRSNAWQGAVGRVKWVMDTLSPVAGVRVIPF
jgi:hypothetical protein